MTPPTPSKGSSNIQPLVQSPLGSNITNEVAATGRDPRFSSNGTFDVSDSLQNEKREMVSGGQTREDQTDFETFDELDKHPIIN